MLQIVPLAAGTGRSPCTGPAPSAWPLLVRARRGGVAAISGPAAVVPAVQWWWGRRGALRRGASLAASFLSAVAAATACPGDVVVVASVANSAGRSRITGEVLDYTGETLRVRRPSGRVESIPSDRVVQVESTWGTHHTAGDRAFEQKHYAEAIDQYLEALAHETRSWVQRRILARIVWCRRYLRRWEQAAETFLILLRSDPATRDFAAIPLAWAARTPSVSLEQRAAGWLAQPPSAAAALIGASWLLTTRRRAEAQEALRRLAADQDLRIGFLAEAQMWRTRAATATWEEAARWRERIGRMPQELRSGPYFTLGRALTRLQLHEQAALAYLRAPILHPANRALAAESLLAAALELEKLNRPREAESLYQELIANYPEDTAAAAAKTRLEKQDDAADDQGIGNRE